MPHSQIDALLPNETLVPGDTLISTDARVHLEFLPNGVLQARQFLDDRGPITVNGPFGGPFGTGNRVVMGQLTYDPFPYTYTGPRLLDATGKIVWGPGPLNFQTAVIKELVMQSDGNLVLYCLAGSNVFANWALLKAAQLPDRLYGRTKCVIPNTTTATVTAATPGTVVLFVPGGQGQGDNINQLNIPCGVRTNDTYMKLDPGGTIGVQVAGQVSLESSQYTFTDNEVHVRSNSDAIQMSDRGPRWHMAIGGSGLRLLGSFGGQEESLQSIDIAKAKQDGSLPGPGPPVE